MLRALENSFDFKGRATRSEYWSFVFFDVIILSFLTYVQVNLSNDYYNDGPSISPMIWLYLIVSGIGRISVLFRRLHDVGLSFGTIPLVIIATIIVALFFNYFSLILVIGLFFSLMADSTYDNEYGICPKGYGPKPQKEKVEKKVSEEKIGEEFGNKREEIDKVISRFKSSSFRKN